MKDAPNQISNQPTQIATTNLLVFIHVIDHLLLFQHQSQTTNGIRLPANMSVVLQMLSPLQTQTISIL
jgi:hypothetical protein